MYKHNQHVYLAGSIEGVSEEEMKGWREHCTRELALRDIKTLDPTRRMTFHQMKNDANFASRIVKHDYADIAYSSVILADLRDSTPGRKWGTISEIAHSHTKNKIIIVVMDKDQFLHPFVQHFATEIYHDLTDAIEAVTTYYQ